jgi:methanogenic corrinoid protein MtbC1
VTSTLPEECLSGLATRAMARLREERAAGRISEAAAACMKAPIATALANALCDDMTDTADLMIEDLIDAGLSVEEVCLDHLAPAARCLGEWWENDRLPFTEVAMATARIQSILRRLPAGRASSCGPIGKGAMFCAVPGEQHTLGVMMAADLFRRSGWDVSLLVDLDHDDTVSRIARDDRAVVGLSCSGRHTVDALRRLMEALRKVRPDAHLMISGQITGDAQALARLPAADAVVRSVAEAEALMARLEADMRRRGMTRAASVA